MPCGAGTVYGRAKGAAINAFSFGESFDMSSVLLFCFNAEGIANINTYIIVHGVRTGMFLARVCRLDARGLE